MTWETVPLGEILELRYGRALKAEDRSGDGFAVIGSGGPAGLHRTALVRGPTIVVGRKGSIGSLTYAPDGCWPIDTAYYISLKREVDLRWLYWTMHSLGLEAMNKSAAVPGLNREDAYRSQLPLPPLPEQRRIAAILDEADALRQVNDRALSAAHESRRAEVDGALRESAPRRRLGDVATLFGGSSLPTGEPFAEQEGGYLMLKVSDLNLPGNELVVSKASLWSHLPGPRSSTAPAGSIVLPKRGASIATNKKRVLDRPAILDPNLMGVHAARGEIEPAWLHAWFEALDLATIQSGSSVPQLNKQDLVPLEVPVPPLERQANFAARQQELFCQIDALRKRTAVLDALFASLQYRAFRGEL